LGIVVFHLGACSNDPADIEAARMENDAFVWCSTNMPEIPIQDCKNAEKKDGYKHEKQMQAGAITLF